FKWLSVTNTGHHFHFFILLKLQIFTYPMYFFIFNKESAAVKSGMILALSGIDYIFFHIGINYEKRLFCSAHCQSLSLALGEIMRSVMCADGFPIYFGIFSFCGKVFQLFFF